MYIFWRDDRNATKILGITNYKTKLNNKLGLITQFVKKFSNLVFVIDLPILVSQSEDRNCRIFNSQYIFLQYY